MSWHFVERWLQKVNQHSTLIGKFWITFLIVFRIVVVSSVGDRVYSDEQSEFKCNTMQVGCPNVCFNKFSPISHIRFWSFQIIMVTTPSIVFMVYSAHQIKKKPPSKEKSSVSGPPAPPSPKKTEPTKEIMFDEDDKKRWKKTRYTMLKNTNTRITYTRHIQCTNAFSALLDLTSMDLTNKQQIELESTKLDRKVWEMSSTSKPPMMRQSSMDAVQQEITEPRKTVIQEMFGEDKAAFSQHYVLYGLSVVMRTGVEVVFIYLQYQMFGFQVTELFKCEGDPCPNKVDCFVSRPMEKTIFLWFMFVIAIICFFLNVLELQYLFWQFCIRRPRLERARRRMLKRPTTSESQTLNLADAEILDGGTISGPQTATAPPAYRNGDMYDDTFELTQIQGMPNNPIAMSFSMDDAILPENIMPTSKYMSYQINPASVSSNSNNFAGPVTQEAQTDQPYLANPREETAKANNKGYYDYV